MEMLQKRAGYNEIDFESYSDEDDSYEVVDETGCLASRFIEDKEIKQ